MKQRLPYYGFTALFVIAGHLEAQGLHWSIVADVLVVALLLLISGIAVGEFLVFERERILRTLDEIEEHAADAIPVPESPEESTLVIPLCRDDEPEVHPMFAGVRSGFADAEAALSAQADEASALLSATFDEAARELGVA